LSDPRLVTLTLPAIKSLTILEIARASATARVKRADTERLLRTMLDPAADPSELELGATLLYAWAWQLVRRDEPATPGQDAQTWRVEFDLDATDELAEVEAIAVAEAVLATGLPPDQAARLTLTEVAAYAEVRSRELEPADGRR
jgi:hypothetical protein